MLDATKRFADNRVHMGSKPNKVNSVTMPAEMLGKIAAANDLTVADVVRLFLIEALPEPASKLGTLEVPPAIQRRFTHENRKLPRQDSNCHWFKNPFFMPLLARVERFARKRPQTFAKLLASAALARA